MNTKTVGSINEGSESQRAANPIARDPKTVSAACEEMDRMREETRARVGTVNVAVELVRDARK